MDDNNLQDLFNLGSDDNTSANTTQPKNDNPNVAPLDDLFNSVEPLSSNPKQAEINNTTAAKEPPLNSTVQSAAKETVQNVGSNINQVNQTVAAANEEVNKTVESVHSTIDTNPMQTTLTENSVNQAQSSTMPPEPDPMFEHMIDNSVPGADLNNAFSANTGNVSAPNPSDVYRNSAAMNYANNAQSQVNFNQQQQNNANGYTTKKKTNPLLVALLIFLIIAVLGVLGYFVYTTVLTKKDNKDQNTNQNTVTPVVDNLPDTYQYLSDIESLSSKSKEKIEKQSEYALIDSTHGFLTQSRLPLSLHFDLENEYFILDVNKNKDIFFEDIKIPRIQEDEADEVVFYFINSNLEFVKGTLTITDLTGYDLIKTAEEFETVTISLWDLFYDENELDGFYKLNDRYFLKLRIEDSNIASLEEDELQELLESIVLDFSVSIDSEPTDRSPYTYLDGYVEIDEKEYKEVELDDNFSLNLVDSLYITSWTINKTDNANVITALTKDDSYNIQIVELEEPIQNIDNLAAELSTDYNAAQTLFATYTDDSGFELAVPVIADNNGNLLGIAVESEETCYLFLIAGSSIENGYYATTYISQEAFLDQMTYLFKNVIKYSGSADDRDTHTVPNRADDDDEEDEENTTNTNSTNEVENETENSTNSSNSTGRNTNTAQNEEDED